MLTRSDALKKLITAEIKKSGPISFADFMQFSLYTPELGYYTSPSEKFGKLGDFITAPGISPLFATCLANQFMQVIRSIPNADILEIGAGSGEFAKNVLLTLEEKNCLPNYYYIYEISSYLRAEQKKLFLNTCPHLLSKIKWLDLLSNFKVQGIIFANEVMDAIPFHCFRTYMNKNYERKVTVSNNEFVWHYEETDSAFFPTIVSEKIYDSEIHLNLIDWIATIAKCLERGIITLLDYGYPQQEYYHPDRNMGTLKCFHQHTHHDNPFINIGLQDITCHVNFTKVAEYALKNQLNVAGYTTQAHFLLNLGLLDLVSPQLNFTDQYQLHQQIKRLTYPSEMGEIIKAIAFEKNFHEDLIGFSHQDRTRSL